MTADYPGARGWSAWPRALFFLAHGCVTETVVLYNATTAEADALEKRQMGAR